MRALTLMVQGTSSDAGKSTLVTGLCRLLRRQGLRVAPFKPQNMALNSAVTVDGGEIGRAQALQAAACGLAPHSDMNPVLLKPNSDVGAQVIVQGRAIGNFDATPYHHLKPCLQAAVLESHARLAQQYDVVVVEGAGSPAEINLREGDIANMGFAEAVDCPVILVADIDRGGVFAQLVGSLALLSSSEQARIKGFVINRFRGELALLQPGLDWLEAHTGKPVLGVLPYLPNLRLDAEDALPRLPQAAGRLRVVVPVLPRISNHTDFDPLRDVAGVELCFIAADQTPPPAELVILPGSKNTRADLAWLRAQGWEAYLARHLRYGGRVLGICGGFQMLGQVINDPLGVEGDAGSDAGLAWLQCRTDLAQHKQLRTVHGRLSLQGAAVQGYEIHVGCTTGEALARPFALLEDGRRDGAWSEDGQIAGTYLHGVFDRAEACQALLRWAGWHDVKVTEDLALRREREIERLADCCAQHLRWAQLAEQGLWPAPTFPVAG